MTDAKQNARRELSRRSVLKGGAAAVGVAAGSSVVTGFPTVWAQNIKDVTLNHTGQSYSTLIDIARQASQDLGFKVEMSVTDHPGMTNRMVNDPESIDVADTEIWQTKVFVPLGKTQAVDTKRIKLWDKMTPLYTQGVFAGNEVSRQGDSPYEIMYRESKDATSFHDGPTEWATFMPGVYNADTLGIRPDLVGREISSWADLLDPAFSGKSAIQNIPAIGFMDAVMALESAGEVKYVDKGNLTRDEIDQTIAKLIERKRAGHWRALWNTFDESVNLMASGEVVIQSMWSPAVTAVRSRGIPCFYIPLKEGYRAWASCIAPMAHLEGLKLDAAYEYLNWYQSGWQGAFIAKQGYYTSVPETAKGLMTENEWNYWYDGLPAQEEILDPYGNHMEDQGHVRDGGAFWERMGNVACWNTLMDENRYMIRKWNEFIAS